MEAINKMEMCIRDSLQQTIDRTRDYLIRAVPQAQFSIDEAQKILAQRTYTPVSYTHLDVYKRQQAYKCAGPISFAPHRC